MSKPDEAPAKAPMPPLARLVTAVLTIAAIALAMHQLFNMQLFGIVLLEGRYLYILGAIFLGLAFLVFPLRPAKGTDWPDWLLFAVALFVGAYFAWTAEESLDFGWEYAAPDTARWFSIVFYLLILEATRRAGGLV
ncbi:MAG: hypothetical protein AAFU55_02845, partial [Pseudomonadota bacterium]